MKRQGLSTEYKQMIGAGSQESTSWQEIELRKIALAHACGQFKDGYDPKAVIKAAEQFYEFLSGPPPLQEVSAKLPDSVQPSDVKLAHQMVNAARAHARSEESRYFAGLRSTYDSEELLQTQRQAAFELPYAVLTEMRRYHAHFEAIYSEDMARRRF